MASQTLKIAGLDALKQKLAEIPRSLRRSVLRNALKAGALVNRNEARRLAPVLRSDRKGRKPGTVKKAILVRTSKLDTRLGDVGVFVNVKPAKGAVFKKGVLVKESQRGKDSENDPYYWRWLEFGRKQKTFFRRSRKTKKLRKVVVGKIEPFAFLQKAADKLPESLDVIENKLTTWFEQVNANGNTKP